MIYNNLESSYLWGEVRGVVYPFPAPVSRRVRKGCILARQGAFALLVGAGASRELAHSAMLSEYRMVLRPVEGGFVVDRCPKGNADGLSQGDVLPRGAVSVVR